MLVACALGPHIQWTRGDLVRGVREEEDVIREAWGLGELRQAAVRFGALSQFRGDGAHCLQFRLDEENLN